MASKEAEATGITITRGVDTSSSRGSSTMLSSFDERATKTLLRKLDLHIVPFFALLYLLCYLDRSNIGNARLVNLEKDLGMVGLDYNVALAVFFPFYVAAEIPSNMMMKRFRPSIWITFIMVSWAIIMICMGLVTNYGGLLGARIFLGIAEGGFFPGVNYYITQWYKRHECGLRMALFFSAATAAGAFGGLLARGISAMDGILGRGGWSWIFILEGCLTFVIACTSYWFIQDYPSTARFLTPIERGEVTRRLKEDNSQLSDEFSLRFVRQALSDWKIYIHMLIIIGIITPLYSFSLFLPTIIKNLGYSNNNAQLMTVPPYVAACLVTVATGYATDRMKQRGVFMLLFEVIAIAGFTMLLASDQPGVQYAGTFLAAIGIYPLVPMGVAWNSNNIGGSLKRGIGIAMQIGFGNLGGVIASFTYLTRDEPRFIKGHAVLIGLLSMSFVLTTFMTVYLRRENARRDALGINPVEYSSEQKEEQREKGDEASFFRYTV